MRNLFLVIFILFINYISYSQCNGPLEVDLVIDYADCSNPNSGVITLLNQDPDSVTYSINGAAAVNTPQFTDLGPGTYNFVINDTTGCSTTATGVIPDPLEIDFVDTITSCSNSNTGMISLNGLNGFPIYQYSYNGGLTFDTSSTLNEIGPGIYHVVLKDSYNCEIDTMITVDAFPTISPTITTENEQCNGTGPGSVDVTFAGGGSYGFSLNGGTSTSGMTYNNMTLLSGFYVLSVTDQNGCTSPFQFQVGADLVDDSVKINNEICHYGNADIEVFGFLGVAPYEYSIDNGTTYLPSGAYSDLSQGNYVVLIKDSTGCIKADSIYVANFGGVEATASNDDTVCLGNNTIVSVSHNGGINSSYQWNNGLGNAQSHTVSPNTSTTYSVIVTDSYGCKDTVETIISVETFPVVSLSENQVQACIGDNIELIAFGADRYEWSSGSTTDMIDYIAIGNETITVTGFNGQCSDQEQMVIIIKPSPTAIASSDVTSINTGESISFSNAGSVTSTTNWDFGDGFNSLQSSPIHQYDFAGAYIVVLTSEMGGCEASDSILVYVGTVSIDESNEMNVLVYPNPAKEFVTIEVNETGQLSLFSISGELITQKELFKGANRLSVDHFSKGLYLAKVKSINSYYEFKLVID